MLQIQEGVTSVKAERVLSLTGAGPESPVTRFPLSGPPAMACGLQSCSTARPYGMAGQRRYSWWRCRKLRGPGCAVDLGAGDGRPGQGARLRHAEIRSTLPGPPTPRRWLSCWVAPEATATCSRASAANGWPRTRRPTYTVIEIKRGGFSRGYTVIGPGDREWSVKLPPEAPTEVVASRSSGASGITSRRSTCSATGLPRRRRLRTRSCRPASARRIPTCTASTTASRGRTTRTRSSARGS